MATAQEVLKRAKGQKGTTENPPGSNRTKYGKAYGLDGYAWCAMFVWWVLTEKNVNIVKSAYTPTMADWFRQQSRGFSDDGKAKPGDIVFFDFPDSLHRIQHVGFVISNENGRLTTIEGNTSSGSSGSQDNGGGVFIRTRGYGEAVYFGRPKYEDAKQETPRFDFPKKAWFGKGDKGADVRNWQRDLNQWMRAKRRRQGKKLTFDFGRLTVDGDFGKDTVRATKTFQAQTGLDVDARVGRNTIERMESAREWQEAHADDKGA